MKNWKCVGKISDDSIIALGKRVNIQPPGILDSMIGGFLVLKGKISLKYALKYLKNDKISGYE